MASRMNISTMWGSTDKTGVFPTQNRCIVDFRTRTCLRILMHAILLKSPRGDQVFFFLSKSDLFVVRKTHLFFKPCQFKFGASIHSGSHNQGGFQVEGRRSQQSSSCPDLQVSSVFVVCDGATFALIKSYACTHSEKSDHLVAQYLSGWQ